MTKNEQELYELVLALQAEISALKELMRQASPDLMEQQQELRDQLLEVNLTAWYQNHPDLQRLS